MTRTGYLVRYVRCDPGRERVLPTAAEPVATMPLRMFTTRAAAEEYCAELHRHARRTLNVFLVLRAVEPFGERLRDLGVPFMTMPCDVADWGHYTAWYDAEAPHLSDAERALVWGCFDSALYDVTEATWEE